MDSVPALDMHRPAPGDSADISRFSLLHSFDETSVRPKKAIQLKTVHDVGFTDDLARQPIDASFASLAYDWKRSKDFVEHVLWNGKKLFMA